MESSLSKVDVSFNEPLAVSTVLGAADGLTPTVVPAEEAKSNIIPFADEIDDPSEYRVRLMVDRTTYKNRDDAGRHGGAISNRLGTCVETISLSELIEVVTSGGSFCPGVMSGKRCKENWVAQQVYCLDFDGGLTESAFKARCQHLDFFPVFIYPSFRHTAERPRFRAVFVAEKETNNPNECDQVLHELARLFPETDPKSLERAHFFFGTCHDTTFECWDARLPEDFGHVQKAASVQTENVVVAKPVPFANDAASTLATFWKKGQRNQMTMALSGLLMRHGWDDQRIKEFVSEVTRLASDEEPLARLKVVEGTRKSITAGKEVVGGPTLEKLIGDSASFSLIVRCLGLVKSANSEGGNSTPESLNERNQRTDLGNAEAFAKLAYGKLVFVATKDVYDWRAWDGMKWTSNGTDHAFLTAMKTIEQLQQQALADTDSTRRETMLDYLVKCRSAARLQSMVNLARRLPNMRCESSAFNRYPDLINHPNAIVNLRSLQSQPHNASLMITKCAKTPYIELGTEPVRWLKTLDFAFNGNGEFIRWFGKIVARAFLHGESRDEFYICFGTGANLKTTIFETLRQVFGSDYVETADPCTFMSDNDTSRNVLARLQGVKLVIGSESADGKLFNESLMKRITSGEEIEAKFLYKDIFTYKPEFTMFFLTNHKPVIRGADYGIWRRTVLIPFAHRLPESERDPHMIRKLVSEEGEGIIRWVYDHVRLYLEDGIGARPEAVVKATAEYQRDSNVVQNFLDEVCVVDADEKIRLRDMHAAYCAYRTCRGMLKVKDSTLRADLESMGVRSTRHSNGYYVHGFRIEESAVAELMPYR